MKDRHNAYYDSITPESSNAEFLERVLRKAEAMDNKKTFNKRPLIIAAAAALTLCAGVSAVAATGLLDFNAIFGNAITAEDEQLGAELLGGVSNVQYTVSDDDYIVTLNGVTGSPASLIAHIEISRADGQPINNMEYAYLDVKDIVLNNFHEGFSGGRYEYGINENGSIAIGWEHRLSYDKLLEGETLLAGPVSVNGTVTFEDNGELNDLEWQTTFDYTPSAESLRSLTPLDTSVPCTINCEYFDSDELIQSPCTIEKLRLTSTVGVISASINDAELFAKLNDGNTIRLIKKDGSEVIAAFAGGYPSDDNARFHNTIHYYTDETLCHLLAVDLDEIAAISINGTVYELA